jgi:class 3 adenylate cyclase
MKHLYVLLALLLTGVAATAQSDRILQEEQRLRNLTQPSAQIDKLIELSALYAQEAKLPEALAKANRAYQLAQSRGDVPRRVAALRQQASVLWQQKDGKEAAEKLDQGYALLMPNGTTTELRQQLLLMRDLAQARGKNKDVADFDRKLSVLKGDAPATAEASKRDRDRTQEENRLMAMRLAEVNKEREQLEAARQRLDADKQQLTSEKERLTTDKAQLGAAVKSQQQVISTMTEQQAKAALTLARQQIALDSLAYLKLQDSLEIGQQRAQLKQQEAEIGQQRAERNLLIVGVLLILGVAAGLFNRFQVMKRYNRQLAEKNAIIEQERQRAEKLLLNILPATVAGELKVKGFAQTQSYDQVSVLFTDFKGFSKIAEVMTPQELVADLDYCFKAFDSIVGLYGLEKIKTIGDSYMCAGGLPDPDPSHPVRVVRAAQAMQAFMESWQSERDREGKPLLEIRIGIHTGPIVAGVVGEKKFAYDIWGDTVNVASRMESSGEAGKINVSGATFELIREQFACTHRGKIFAKNKGEVDMYFVEYLRSEVEEPASVSA